MSLVLLIPVLRRPYRVVPLMESVVKVTPEPYRLLFIASPEDFKEHEALDRAGADWIVMDDNYEGRGDYARKINLGYNSSTEDLIFLGADDLNFHEGWFEACLDRLSISSHYGVVGTNDLGNRWVMEGRHSTHSLVTRSYVDQYGTIDEPGKILHEGYMHEFVDNEFVETAMSREAWVFAHNSRVEHLHPAWGKAQSDALYRASPIRTKVGLRLFLERRKLWKKSQL